MVELRSFDAFPKVKSTYKEKQRPDMLATVVFGWFTLVLLWLVTTNFMGARLTYEYGVYKQVEEVIQINFDVSVAARCEDLAVYIEDMSGDRLFVNELVAHAEDTVTPMALGYPAGTSWCRMGGLFNTNRVKGRLGVVNALPGTRTPVDISHYTNELSFGEYFPSEANPLDNTFLKSQPGNVMLYHLNLVPTRYEALGLSAHTYQYSTTMSHKESKEVGIPSGIYWAYDFDPISMVIKDTRLGFFSWLFRLANIVGGLGFALKWFNKRKMHTMRENGLLDKEVPTE